MPEITQEEFDMLEAYKTLGSPQDLASQRSGQTLSAAAEKYNFKKSVLERLLKTLPSDNNLLVSEDGVFINTPEGDVELSKYAEDEWSEFMPSLKADTQFKEKTTIPFITQSAESRGTTKKDLSRKNVDNYITQQYGWVFKTDSVN